MSARTSPDRQVVRRRAPHWEPPRYGSLFRRKADGTVWVCRGIYRHDRQVRLEREGERPQYPCANMLAADWEQLVV